MIYLFIFEFSRYFDIKTTSEMLIDLSRGSDKLKVNIDISLNRLPCSILSLDLADFMGSHSLNIKGNLVKTKLDKNGYIVDKQLSQANLNTQPSQINEEEIKQALLNEEGCRMIGSFEVFKVPGNFHISTHAHGRTLMKLIAENETLSFDLTHTIHRISFGNEADIKEIKNSFNLGILSPLDGVYTKDEKNQKSFEYYLDIVPTYYVDLNKKEYHVHQFTANKNQVKTHIMIPTIYFRYDISPILVKFIQEKPNIFQVIINVCAIFGGMFTIAGIIDTLLLKIIKTSSNKKE